MQITITGATSAELLTEAQNVVALLGGTSAVAINAALSASDQARLRGDAVVVPPSGTKEPTAAEKKAAAAAAKAAAAKAAAEAVDEVSDEDVLGEDEGDETEALTNADVKALLIEVRNAYPKDATIISAIVKEYGKQTAISKVEDKLLPKVAARCRELLAKAK